MGIPYQDRPGQRMADTSKIPGLIAALGSMNDNTRFTARKQLVHIGLPAIPALEQVLHSPNHVLRWGAVKALTEIGDLSTAPTLVRVLEDDVFDIRWIASEGLIAMGFQGLQPLLQELIDKPDIPSLRESAHHVFHVLSEVGMGKLLYPVVTALEAVEPSIATPPAAQSVLDVIRQSEKPSGSK